MNSQLGGKVLLEGPYIFFQLENPAVVIGGICALNHWLLCKAFSEHNTTINKNEDEIKDKMAFISPIVLI